VIGVLMTIDVIQDEILVTTIGHHPLELLVYDQVLVKDWDMGIMIVIEVQVMEVVEGWKVVVPRLFGIHVKSYYHYVVEVMMIYQIV